MTVSSILSRTSLCLALLLWAVPAAAARDLAEEKARAALKRAQQAYDLGEFEGALQSFSEAYRLKPLPGFLFNLGQCHRQLGHYDRASFFYRRFLELSPTRPSNAPVVQELITEMDGKLKEQQLAANRPAPSETPAVTPPLVPVAEPPLVPAAAASHQAPAAAVEVHAEREGDVPLYRKPWVWVGAGVVVAAVITGVAIASSSPPQRSGTTLGEIDASR